jgi:hypothetical protein
MQHQVIFSCDTAVKRNDNSTFHRANITAAIFIFCITFLSSCAVWVRTPGDYDNGHGRHDNGRHRGERHGER